MPYFILGITLIILGTIFARNARKSGDKDGVFGSIAMITAGVILAVIFGLFYWNVTLNT